ncbi:peptidoglycan D,D-transpeptidase FtsI family protein [Nocardioides sp. Root151]|uniref:peptidoglycan D,D-transpeptidase FtsI family protein n=1 Tax=Nocardioides sp. Root151 TaxID=1736475 RepID=UPI000A3D9382|nr:penicillin-binding protein 2 [Nocardioides sp. Root151]
MSLRPQTTRAPARGSALFRLRFGFVVIAMVLSAFGARLLQLQGIDPHAYAAMAAREGVQTVDLPAARGAIVDRNGVELASTVDGLRIIADPQMTEENAGPIASYLSQELGIDYFATLGRLRKDDTRYQYIARRVPSTKARRVVDALEEKGYKGLTTERDPMRDYPADDIAANLIGFLGEDEALAGFERTFDKQLSGVDGETTYEVGGGNRIPLGTNNTVKPVDGQDLQLTIERDVQFFTQRVLREAVRGAKADSGTAIAMNVETGEILADADYPSYNANEPLESPKRNLGSRATSDPYEPGSVEKVLTFASLIDAGKITPRTPITVPPVLESQGAPIHDHWDHETIHLTAAGALSKSSNIGTALSARQFTPEQLHAYLTAFGLGQRTNIGVRGESGGRLPDPSSWGQLGQDNIAFGQGLSVNAVQMAAAVNTIANGGIHVDPNIIKGSAVTDDGTKVGTSTSTTRRVVSEDAARQTSEMMELVTDPVDGIAPTSAITGYRVAGKTGTAQRVGKECACYDGTFTVSFGGFAPADAPRFTVYVVIQNPRNGQGGGAAAGPVFRKVMTYLLRKYGVAPTGTSPTTLPVEW